MGRVVDPETALIYLRARYYDPATAQFLTRDPLDAVTRSAYGYVNGNPLNGSDPFGLDSGPLGHGNMSVYRLVDANGNTTYIGITNDLERRAQEWARKGQQMDSLDGLDGLSWDEARGVEQSLIGGKGLDELDNMINSVATSNPKFASRLADANAILRENPQAVTQVFGCEDTGFQQLDNYYSSVGVNGAIEAQQSEAAIASEGESVLGGLGGGVVHVLE